MCPPSQSEHGLSAIMITAPMYYHCYRNFGNCYGTREDTLFVSNSIFDNNTGGERGLFDLRCVGAKFTNSRVSYLNYT